MTAATGGRRAWDVGRYLFFTSLLLAAGANGLAQPAPTKSGLFASTSRIRPASDFEAGVIADGVCRSETLRSMVETLQTSDVIVYVTMRPVSDRAVAGGLEFLGATTTDRILRAVIAFPLDRISRMAMLGHELHHAIEVANNAAVRNRRAFDDFYKSHGIQGATQVAHETEAARQAQWRVRAEVVVRDGSCDKS